MSEDPLHDFAAATVERQLARRSSDAEHAVAALLAAEDALAAARGALADSLEHGGAFGTLARRAALDAAEVETLAVAVGVERSEHLQRLIVSITGDRDRHRVELALLAEMLGPEYAAATGPSSGLQRAGLVELGARGAFSRSTLEVAPRVMWALLGDRRPDPALPAGVEWIAAGGDEEGPGDGGDAAVMVVGHDRARRRQAAVAVVPRSVALLVPASADAGDQSWPAIVREATIAGAGVVLELDALPDATARWWIERAHHLPWVLSCPTPLDMSRAPRLRWRIVEASDADPSDAEWTAALGPDVARTHRLSAEQLDLMRLALPAHDGDFDAALRRMVSPKMETLATHVRPRRGRDDLILTPNRMERIDDLLDRYRNAHRVYDEWGVQAVPSRGLVALFSGPSGTGKTLAAEVVANELGLDLYRLDLSAVVSKWLGDTEKNLDQLFAAAGAGNFVLFFDEADALFAKRGEVNDSHDRYANVETSYLLQRLERYEGIVILATNYEKNIDEAFVRRIHVRIDFALPDEPARLAIWRHHTAHGPRLASDIDLATFAQRFELTGAAIRNAIVDAAFLAASRTAPGSAGELDLASLVRGVAREMRKMGRLVTPSQFGEWFGLVDDPER